MGVVNLVIQYAHMSKEMGPAITGIGVGIPARVVTNEEIAGKVETSDAWIRENVGIGERHVVEAHEVTSDLAARAALEALEVADIQPGAVDEIVVTTVTPDFFFPSTACMVQNKIDAEKVTAFDLAAACTGSIYGLQHAFAMIKAGYAETSLVIGAETLSRIVDWDDRNTCILFGDGAGAVVVQNVPNPGISAFVTRADGSKSDIVMLPGGGSRFPASRDTVDAKMHTIKMRGGEVFKNAVYRMGEAAGEVLDKAHLSASEVDWVIPHQANQRIMDAVAKRLRLPQEKLISNIAQYGNTSSASVLIATCEAYKEGKIKKYDILLLVAFGGGLTYGAAVLQWHLEPPTI